MVILNAYTGFCMWWTGLLFLFISIGIAIYNYNKIKIATNKNKSDQISAFVFSMMTCIFYFVMLFGRFVQYNYVQCTIDNTISFKEVIEKYDIVKCNGEIWTLKEKGTVKNEGN